VAGRTQEALYAEIDLELSWSEDELPQVERTKHVHSLHPYLGKFVPQLVDVFLTRYFSPGSCIYDPFVGSGTTLVEANVFGADGVGCDISAFNCLLSTVKTARYSLGELELALRGTLEEARRHLDGEPQLVTMFRDAARRSPACAPHVVRVRVDVGKQPPFWAWHCRRRSAAVLAQPSGSG